jgi:hypothetical protein
MSVAVPQFSRLCTLPDDVLRALAAFMPPSGLLVLVRCSRQLAIVLRSQHISCLDGLFIKSQINSEIDYCLDARLELPTQPRERDLLEIFGEPDGPGFPTYHFIEAPKGYDGTTQSFRLYRVYTMCFGGQADYWRYFVAGATMPAAHRYACWLQRRCERLRATEVQLNSATRD